MCGIAGIVRLNGEPLDHARDEPILRAMGNALHHRGPDDTQLAIWEGVGFIFKRLSIVDIEGGHQPFETHDGRITAMINGEIFNHQEIRGGRLADERLRTRSDCEVIPYLYVKDGLRLFDAANGMFAAALLDRRERRVLLCRDRMGVKPLYYAIVDGGRTLVFASEIKGLFAHPAVPRVFDWHAALSHDGLRSTSAREQPAGFVGIERVPSATLLEISLTDGRIRPHTYWQAPSSEPDRDDDSAAAWTEHYGALLEDSVRLRLMADTQFGLFLSGGIDSAIVAAMASRHANFPTFSVLSQSTIGAGDAAASAYVAQSLGLPNHQVSFDAFTRPLKADDWRRVLWACELWNSTAEQLYKYLLHGFAKARYPSLKVILLGQGSDEFNGGYTDWTIRNLGRDSGSDTGSRPSRWDEMGECFAQISTEDAARTGHCYGRFGDLIDRQVIGRDFVNGCSPARRNPDTWASYRGYYRENLDYHLWHEDRTASAHSIENRVPFMDYRLIEHVCRAPRRLHATLFTDKSILRQAALPWLPAAIANRPKGPFFYGAHQHHTFRMMYELFAANGGELVDQALEGSRLGDGPLDPDRFRRYVGEVGADPRVDDINRLMQLINMGLLAEMSSRQSHPPRDIADVPVSEVRLSQSIPLTSVEPIGTVASDELDDDIVLALSAQVSLLELRRNGTNAGGAWYLSRGDRLEERLDSPSWLQFLTTVDGHLTVGTIISACRLNRARVWKNVREGLQRNQLVIVGRGVAEVAPAKAQ